MYSIVEHHAGPLQPGPHQGTSAQDFFLEVACEAAFLVGEPVVKALVRHLASQPLKWWRRPLTPASSVVPAEK